MQYEGSCHCGRIAFTLEAEPITSGVDCNCSLCRRRGGLLAFFPREALRLTTPESDLATYRFNKKHISHHFCPTCGIAPFGEGANPKTGGMTVAVNLRCLPAVDLGALQEQPFDGASL